MCCVLLLSPAGFLRNNTAIYTAKGVEVVPIVDGCQTEGKIALHDSCVDKPTGDNFTCIEQRNFGKCDFPFMVSPLVGDAGSRSSINSQCIDVYADREG